MKYLLLPYGLRVVVLISTWAVFSLLGCSDTMISVEDMDKMIKLQVLVGSNKEQVKSFIDNLQVSLHVFVLASVSAVVTGYIVRRRERLALSAENLVPRD